MCGVKSQALSCNSNNLCIQPIKGWRCVPVHWITLPYCDCFVSCLDGPHWVKLCWSLHGDFKFKQRILRQVRWPHIKTLESLVIFLIRGPQFKAGLLKVLTLVVNILESRSSRGWQELVLNCRDNSCGTPVLLRAYLMKSWATQVVVKVRVWSSVTRLNHVRIALVLPWVPWGKTHTCFSCCCDGRIVKEQRNAPPLPSHPFIPSFSLSPRSQYCPNESHHTACICPTSALFVDLYKTSLLVIFMGCVILPRNTTPSTTSTAPQYVCVCLIQCFLSV